MTSPHLALVELTERHWFTSVGTALRGFLLDLVLARSNSHAFKPYPTSFGGRRKHNSPRVIPHTSLSGLESRESWQGSWCITLCLTQEYQQRICALTPACNSCAFGLILNQTHAPSDQSPSPVRCQRFQRPFNSCI